MIEDETRTYEFPIIPLTDEQREQLTKAMEPTIYQAVSRLEDGTPVYHYGREPETETRG